MDETTTQNLRKSSADAAAGAAAAGASQIRASAAIADAAENAAKPGKATSEHRVWLWSALAGAAVAALQVLSVIPGPWTAPALIISAGLAGGAYSVSRGNVKAAALQAAAAAASVAWPDQAKKLTAGAAVIGAAADAFEASKRRPPP
ncbi:MAG: hypothetical protein ABIR60_08640 [Allosphingosinicella sp.]